MNTNDDILTSWRAEGAVFVAGICTMGFEVLAGRIIAPAFGSSIYTWGAILGVFMLALSSGYWIGGKRAYSNASEQALTTILLSASVAVVVVIGLHSAVIEFFANLPFSPRYGPLLPILFLFGPPIFLLGFISPYAAEICTVQTKGEASGRIYTIGTLGSIVGAFAATYFLIPSLSVLHVQVLFAIVLAVMGLLVSFPPSIGTIARFGGVVLLLTTIVVIPILVPSDNSTVYETQTPYQQLQIKDVNGVRVLSLNDHPQSAMYLDNRSGYVYEYARYSHLAYLYRDPKSIDRVLVLGGGGFSIPKRFVREYNVTVDVVEIDPGVVAAAKRYFNVSTSGDINIHVADARRYLRNTNKTYDVIIANSSQKKIIYHFI